MNYRCPVCNQPTDSGVNREFPFCSPRCRLIDLGQWAAEEYRVSDPEGSKFERLPPPHDDSHTS